MKISGILVSLMFAASMLVGGDALAASGKIEKIENGGRQVTVGGTKYKISGSRTKVMIKGKSADRGDLKVGMTCEVEGKGEAKMVSCK